MLHLNNSSSESDNSVKTASSVSTMIADKTDIYEYTESDFIYQTAPWIDKTAPQLSKFDVELHRRWDQAMAAGVFRYGIDHIVTKVLPGPKHYVGQLNTLRATERRRPQNITSVRQPFDDKAFNFTWVRKEEVIFNLRNVTGSKEKLPKRFLHAAEGAVCNGYDRSKTSGWIIENGDHSSCSQSSLGDCETQGKADTNQKSERHTLVVNVSPMEYGHCLLVPQIDSQSPQVLTETAFQVAIECMLLSRHRGFRMGFNSLCAFASVNHLHFHLYYLEHELVVDYAPVRHLGGKYYEFSALPCPGFALQLHGTTVAEMARMAYRLSSYFHKEDTAHNVYICKGTVFGEERNSSLRTIRLFIWPRRKFIGEKSSDEFNVACIELAGHLPIKEEAGYHTLTEERVDTIIAEASLPVDEYKKFRETVIQMGLEEAETMKKQL